MRKPRAWAVGARPKHEKRADFSALDDLVQVPEVKPIGGVEQVVQFAGLMESLTQALGSGGEDVAAFDVLDVFHFFISFQFWGCLPLSGIIIAHPGQKVKNFFQKFKKKITAYSAVIISYI